MNLAILTLEGTDAILNTLCDSLELEVSSRWRKDAPRRRGGQYLSSGLNAIIADAETPSAMVLAIQTFLNKCQKKRIAFIDSNIHAELSIGVTVGDSTQYIAFVDFSASNMLSLGSLGIALSFSAYPTSDEANTMEEDNSGLVSPAQSI